MGIREIFRRWSDYRQLLRELKSYSDVELAELGMMRSGCAAVAFDAVFGSTPKRTPAGASPHGNSPGPADR